MTRYYEESAATTDSFEPVPTELQGASGLVSSSTATGMRTGRLLVNAFLAAALSTGSPIYEIIAASRRTEEDAESSTRLPECDPALFREVEDLFENGADEFFQDGITSNFSRSLLRLVGIHGRAAVAAVSRYLISTRGRPSVASEALRSLAEYQDPRLLDQTWELLRQSVWHPSPIVRDGAIMGFASIDDPAAALVLLNALRTEPVAELRKLMQLVIDQVAATHDGSLASNSET